MHFVTGDMFAREATIRINTVNTVGVMGKGVALQFKRRYPAMYLAYKSACRAGAVTPGRLHDWVDEAGDVVVVNFPTKRHWRDAAREDDIRAGLRALRQYLAPWGTVDVTLPALGCGHGGLDWQRVRRLVVLYLGMLAAEIWVYSPEDSRR